MSRISSKKSFSFLLPPESYPGRVGLLLTPFLVLVNIFMGVLNLVPMHDGINFMALWLIACIFYVFAALLEYGLVLCIMKRNSMKSTKPKSSAPKSTSEINMDQYAIIIFPVTFLIFIGSFITYKIKITECTE